MDELLKVDPSFNLGMFITKVNNIFIMLHSAVMMDDIDRVRHFISDEVEKKYERVLRELNDKNLRQMYDELNVKNTDIKDVSVNDGVVIIRVDIVSRYMDYFVNKKTGKYISGENTRRIEKINHLVFEKKRGTGYQNIDKKCPGCGANISVNTSGKCEYCGRIFDAENYDWILTSIN